MNPNPPRCEPIVFIRSHLSLHNTDSVKIITMRTFKAFHALSTLLLIPTFASARYATVYDAFDEISDRYECPDPVEYSKEYDIPISCVGRSMTPWPLCLLHNITYFIQASVNSASRCCDFDNLESCRCPFKERLNWQTKMKDWCDNIATCNMTGTPSNISTETWVGSIMEEVGIMTSRMNSMLLCQLQFPSSQIISSLISFILFLADGKSLWR